MSKHLEVLARLLKQSAEVAAPLPPVAAAPVAAEPKTNEKAPLPAAPKVKMAAVLGSLLQQAKKPLMIAGAGPVFKPTALQAWKANRPSGADLPAHAVAEGAAAEPSLFTKQLDAWKAQRAAGQASTGVRPAVPAQPPVAPPNTGIGAPAQPAVRPSAPAPVAPAVKTGAVAMPIPAVRPSTAQLAVHPVATPSPAPLRVGTPALAAAGAGGAAMGGMLGSAATRAAQPGLSDQLLDKGKELGGQVVDGAKDIGNKAIDLGGQAVDGIKNFATGFAQNPMKWDGAHIGTAAGVAALPILHYLLSSHAKKKHAPEDDEE